uniref:HD domain-containing protein n=1 Tax=Candidatus Ventrenecus sp. TaxID=3085654 RepID=UPI0040292170
MERMLLNGLERFSEEEQKDILKSYQFAVNAHNGVYRKSGEEYVTHPIAVAQILLDSQKDCTTVCAGLLHDVIEDTDYTAEDILSLFQNERGQDVVKLVEGVTKVGRRVDMSKQAITYASLRKLMTSCASDIRVVEVKLADRLHNMRTAKYWSEETRKRKILETTQVYIPLAERTGAYRIKNELEDICFQYTYPDKYQAVAEEERILALKSENEMKDIMTSVQDGLTREKIASQVTYRIKNLYGLYLDFERYKKNQKASEDMISLKIILQNLKDCYVALGIVNGLYPSKSVVDFISNPKPNDYRSIHDIITSPSGENYLVKIRDKKMETTAAYGMSYDSFLHRGGFQMFQSVFTFDDESSNDKAFFQKIEKDIFKKTVDFFDRDGHRRSLPQGATALDFAYSIHTTIGLHMGLAIVNGNSVEKNYRIKDGDQINIITGNYELPTEEDIKIAKTVYAKETMKKELKRVLRGI